MKKAIRCNHQAVGTTASPSAAYSYGLPSSAKALNNKTLSGIALVSALLLLTACGGGGFDSTSAQAVLSDETVDNVSICANRQGRSNDDLLQEIRNLTGKETFSVLTHATDIDAENLTWDASSYDVICTEDTQDAYSYNLIKSIDDGQVVYGSQSTEYIGTIRGGTVFGFGGQDIVANLEGGTFYGGNGEDLIDTPIEHGLYTGWAYVSVASDGVSGGEFYGEDGDDFVAQLNGGDFYGEAGQDSVAILIDGRFFGGADNDSLKDPFFGNPGEMVGGEFHGDDGDDTADDVIGGKMFGGTGNDLVHKLSNADFDGMGGNDTVYSLNDDANFNGGTGDDLVDSMSGGTFDGGAGDDSVETYFDGKLIDVEQE